MLKLTLWGTRGSTPVSGPAFQRYGGATTCLELVPLNGSPNTPSRLLIDCGSGLGNLARRTSDPFDDTVVLQTHFHWDHIQGFPLFSPLFSPTSHLRLFGVRRDGKSLRDVLTSQMARPLFPVQLSDLPATLEFEDLAESGRLRMGDLEIQWTELCHPSGSTGYRITCGEATVAFSGDTEVQMDRRRELVDLARGADLLIMDAQYFPDDYPSRRGFGHSTPLDAVEVARQAGVRRLLLTHHDPAHDDDALDRKLALARNAAGEDLEVDNGRDGLGVQIGGCEKPALIWPRGIATDEMEMAQ